MQTSFSIQTNPTDGTGATSTRRNNAAANAGAGANPFGAMLNNEMAQIQAPSAPPAPAPQPAAAPKQAAKPQSDDASQPAQAPASPAPQAAGQDKTASADGAKDADAKDAESDDSSDEAARSAGQNADPASAMLALIASLQPGAKAAPAPTGSAQAFDNLSGNAAKGRRVDANQLTALQAALKSGAKEGAATAAGADKPFGAAAAIRNPALAAAGAALGADDKTHAAAADKTAASDASAKVSTAMLKADPGSTFDPAALSLQQARAAAEGAQNPAPAAAALQAAQPGALDAAQAAGQAVAADQLSAQVGTEAWENQVGQKVVYMVGSEEQTASLTLNPPDLGPMQVVLSVSNDQASVTFSSNQQEVRQALENALPRLREMMSESGIALGNASVNAGMPDGGQSRQQQDGSPRGGRNYGRATGMAGVDAAASDAPAPRVARVALPGERGAVDTFA